MEKYLRASEVIDWQHPTILALSRKIASEHQTSKAMPKALRLAQTAKACFEWVRDEIYHSGDYQMNPVTCCASDVLKYKTGF